MSKNLIIGIDEVGRGPLAGNVVAAAVILPENYDLPQLNDSKKLTAKQRNILYTAIRKQAIAYAIGRASPTEIDELNIFQANLLAMRRALLKMLKSIDIDNILKIIIDGTHGPDLTNTKFSHIAVETIIQGDQTEPAIQAASILAKVTRDRELIKLGKLYPEYGFAQHKGYSTAQHLAALQEHGPTPIHRTRFKRVKELILASND